MAKRRNSGWKQGVFTPTHPEKYRGNVHNIVFRSSWELSFAKFLDGNKHVMEWASEEIAIPYFNPIKKRMANYFPDFWVRFKDKDGNECVELIEIKPSDQVKPPKKGSLEQQATWVQNQAKWKAAIIFCRSKQIKFRILTEKFMFS